MRDTYGIRNLNWPWGFKETGKKYSVRTPGKIEEASWKSWEYTDLSQGVILYSKKPKKNFLCLKTLK